MEKLIQDVIAIDKKAQDDLRNLYKIKEEALLELQLKSQQLENNYQDEILKLRNQRQLSYEEKIKQDEIDFAKKVVKAKTQLNNKFISQEKRWLEEMLDFIIKEV